MARWLIATGVGVLIAALVVVGLVSAMGANEDGGGTKSAGYDPPASYPLARAKAQLAGAPAGLAALHAQSSALLGGGKDAFRARLRALRGHPVVVNKWGSWCGPCRNEFPHFQRESARFGKRVAFLGVDGQDNSGDARDFLRQYPVSYPSYVDRDLSVATALGANSVFPSTVFYDRSGKRTYIRQGEYRSGRELAADIRRYAN